MLAGAPCATLPAQSQSAEDCAALRGLKIEAVEITTAALVPAGINEPAPYPGGAAIGPLPAELLTVLQAECKGTKFDKYWS